MRRVVRQVLGVVVVVAAIVSASAPAASATTPASAPTALQALVGVNSHLVWRGDAGAQLARIAAGGVGHVRESFMWNELEPTRGAYSWSKTDRLMAGASAAGVDVLAVLTHSPLWATTVAGEVDAPPTNPADYASAAAAVAGRYGANGTFWAGHPELTPRPLAGLELWNEPWGYWDWEPGPDPAAYAELAQLAAHAVRATAPSLRILVPGDLLQVRRDGQIVGWVDEVLQAQPALSELVTAWSVHPYPDPKGTSPLTFRSDRRWDYGRVELIRDVVRARGSLAPIWITEIGWHTSTSSNGVTEATQAQFVRDAVSHASTAWAGFVERVFVYAWGWDSVDAGNAEGRYALLHADDSPKPAWLALIDLLAAPAPTTATTTAPSTTTSTAPTTVVQPPEVAVPRPDIPPPSAAPAPILSASSAPTAVAAAEGGHATAGYWMVTTAGEVHAFGAAPWHGNAEPNGQPFVDLEPRPVAGNGYWIVDRIGRVSNFGAAPALGDAQGLVQGESVTSLSATPSGHGYWLFTTNGRVLPFGDAPFVGDLAGTPLNAPVLDSIPTPSGHGYYLVAADGGIFTFGDARFAGSTGDLALNAPVQSLVPDPDGAGYWLVASDGGIFAFDAPFYGSMGDTRLNRPVTAMVGGGGGYLMVGEDGGIFTFAEATFHGSLGATPPAQPVASVSVLTR